MGAKESMDQAAVWFAVLLILGDKGFGILNSETIYSLEIQPGETEVLELNIGANKDTQGIIVLEAMGKLPHTDTAESHTSDQECTFSECEPLGLIEVTSDCFEQCTDDAGTILIDMFSDSGSELYGKPQKEIIEVVCTMVDPAGDRLPQPEFCFCILVNTGIIQQVTLSCLHADKEHSWSCRCRNFMGRNSGPASRMAALPGDGLAIFCASGSVALLKPTYPRASDPGQELGSQTVFHFDDMDSYSQIHDFVPVSKSDIGKQARLCVACGEGKAGSLRMLTTGYGVSAIHSESNPESELKGATFLWSVSLHPQQLERQILVVSFVQATRALATGEKFSDVTESIGLISEANTIACGRISDGLLVQVTPSHVALCSSKECAQNAYHKHITSALRSSLESRISGHRLRRDDLNKTNDRGWESCQGLLSVYEKSSITVAAVAEGLVCIISGGTQDITVIGISISSDPSDTDLRPKKQHLTELVVWGSAILWNDAPSSSEIIPGKDSSTWFCIVGTYRPGMSIFFIPGFCRSPIPYCQLSSHELCTGLLRLHRSLDLSHRNELREHYLENCSPVPESIIYLYGTPLMDGVLTTFLIGFRNGMLGEYAVHNREEKRTVECLSLVELGTRPVMFARLDKKSTLCISDNIFIARRCRLNGRLTTTPVAMSANIISATVLWADTTIWSNICTGYIRTYSCLFDDGKQIEGDPIPVVAYVDDFGGFSLAALREGVHRFGLNAEPQHLLAAPGTNKMQFLTSCSLVKKSELGVEEVCDIRLIDMEAGEEKARLSVSPGSSITSMCLWPGLDFMQELELTDASQPNEVRINMVNNQASRGSPITQVESNQSGEVSKAVKVFKKSTSGINYCLSTARDMAASLMCFRFIGRQPVSWCSSTANLEVSPSSRTFGEKIDGFLVTAGTRRRKKLGINPSHRGDLLLLRVWPVPETHNGKPQEKWKIGVVASRAMPDPVWAVAKLTDKFVVASVGNRLVCYDLTNGKWERRGWIVTHDKITSLSTSESSLLVAAGDSYNSVVLYKYSMLDESFKVVSCDPCSRTNTGVLVCSREEETIFAIDGVGCFCSLGLVSGEGTLLSGLKERALFDLQGPLSRLVPLVGMATESMLIASKTGSVHFITALPKIVSTIAACTEGAILKQLTSNSGLANLALPLLGVGARDCRSKKNVVDGNLLCEILSLPKQLLDMLLTNLSTNPILREIAQEHMFSCGESQPEADVEIAVKSLVMHTLQNMECYFF